MKHILILIIFLLNIPLQAQLSLNIVSIDASNLPIVEARISVKENNIPVELKVENLLVKENNKAQKILSISQLNVDNEQIIRWIPNHDFIDIKRIYSFELLVIYNFTITSKFTTLNNLELPLIFFKLAEDQSQEPISEIFFGDVEPGDSKTVQIYGVASRGVMHPEQGEISVRIDSITTNTDNFEIVWVGATIDPSNRPPPTAMMVFGQYLINIHFKPTTTDPYSDVFTIYYNGGATKRFNMYGNSFDIKKDPLLKVKYPNGGENFAPCQDVDVEYVGNTTSLPTTVEYSANNGATWEEIGVEDAESFIEWTIPNIETEEALVRVSTKFNKTKDINLPVGSDVQKVSFNSDGKLLASAQRNGTIILWDMNLNQKIVDFDVSQSSVEFLGISFLTDNIISAVMMEGNKNYIIKYDIENSQLLFKNEINNDVLRFAKYDIVNSTVFLVSVLNNKITIINLTSGKVVDEITRNEPITAFSLNSDSNIAALVTMTGKLSLLNLNSLVEIKSTQLHNMPIIIDLEIAPKSNIIALAGMQNTSENENNATFVYETETESIIDVIRPAFGNAVGLAFSPTSTMLVIGSRYNPMIYFYDLVRQEKAGSFGGSQGVVTDVAFSKTDNTLAYGTKGFPTLTLTKFAYPEQDESDSTFTISKPILQNDSLYFEEQLVATETIKEFSTEICNTGESIFTVQSASLMIGKNFKIIDKVYPEEIGSGECSAFEIVFNPVELGELRDTLLLHNCGNIYKVPIVANSRDRNLVRFENPIDLFEACVGDKNTTNTIFISNGDNVDVLINKVFVAGDNADVFGIEEDIDDLVLRPNDNIRLTFTGVPDTLGIISSNIRVLYENLVNIYQETPIKIQGIGTYLNLSNSILPFISEIKTREVIIKNSGIDVLTINNILAVPNVDFEVMSNFPINLNPGEETIIEVLWKTDNIGDAKLVLDADPCPLQRNIPIVEYYSNTELSIGNIETDPADRSPVHINVIYSNNENAPYNGVRSFDGVFTIGYRHFFPTQISSSYEFAEFENMGVEDGLRKIKVKITGNFQEEDTLFTLTGVSGLAETQYSVMNFDENNSTFFGDNVDITINQGSYKLTNLFQNRLLIRDETLNINSISPNPAKENIEIVYNTNSSDKLKIELYNSRGEMIEHSFIYNHSEGENKFQYSLPTLNSGKYLIKVSTENISDTKELLIAK